MSGVFLPAVLALASVLAAPPPAPAGEAWERLLDAHRIDAATAVRAAAATSPGARPMRVALRRRGDAIVQDVVLLAADRMLRVEVDALTGELVRTREQDVDAERRRELILLDGLLRTASIPLLKAGDLALDAAPGTRVLIIEADVEDGSLQYEVTLHGPRGLTKSELDAETGEIRSIAGSVPLPPFDPRLHRFDHGPPGALPRGWVSDAPGVDAPPAWKVVEDAAAPSPPNVLMLSGPAIDRRAGLMTWNRDVSLQDVDADVRVRCGDGGAGGLIWRVRDALEHYALIVDAAAKELRVEVVRDGARRTLLVLPVEVDPMRWIVIGIRHDGDRIAILLDGERRAELRDSTLPGAGAVGVWCRGDAKAHFDDLRAEALSAPGD